MSNNSHSASLRLMRDLKDLLADPVPGVAAKPLNDSNMFVWHANLFPLDGPYANHPFHLILQIPSDYPKSPPKVELGVVIPHPNIFNHNFICLDLLQKDYNCTPYVGWSSAYTIRSVLMQLMAFFFDARVPQKYGRDVLNDVSQYQIDQCLAEIERYKCSACRHSFEKPVPSQQKQNEETKNDEKQEDNRNDASNEIINALPKANPSSTGGSKVHQDPFAIRNLMSFLPAADIKSCKTINQDYHQVISNKRLIPRQQLMCFHRRVAFDELDSSDSSSDSSTDLSKTSNNTFKEVLGYGIHVEFYGHVHDVQRPLKQCSAVIDYLSYKAFTEEKVRLGVWKEPFEYFLPLAINASHQERALPILIQTAQAILPHLSPGQAILDILASLMTITIVSIMKDSESNNSSYVTLHASEKCMLAYTAFHHLLVFAATQCPEIVKTARYTVESFMNNQECRVKAKTPNLGHLLIYLSILSDYPQLRWQHLARSFINELFTRQVLWSVREQSELGSCNVTTMSTCFRLTRSFQNAITGLRLVAFQVYFLRTVLNDLQSKNEQGEIIPDQLMYMNNVYNERLGMPKAGTGAQLQLTCKRIMNLKDYGEWYDFLELKRPHPKNLEDQLVQAIRRSKKVGYHKPKELPQFALLHLPKCVCDRDICCWSAVTSDEDAEEKEQIEKKLEQNCETKPITSKSVQPNTCAIAVAKTNSFDLLQSDDDEADEKEQQNKQEENENEGQVVTDAADLSQSDLHFCLQHLKFTPISANELAMRVKPQSLTEPMNTTVQRLIKYAWLQKVAGGNPVRYKKTPKLERYLKTQF